jgi:hypothetical protein
MRLPAALLAGLLLAVPLAGCGSSSARTSNTAASPTRSTAVNPNAPEVNPAGDIPDTQVYVRYTAPDGSYAIRVPEGWSRSTSGAATVFTGNLNSVRVESAAAGSAPTPRSVRTGELPRLAATAGFRLQGVSTVGRPAGSAVKIAYLARSAADTVTGKTTVDAIERYMFFHRGRELTITLSGPRGADNVDPWRLITSSLRWTR